jgi:hypothetical protein
MLAQRYFLSNATMNKLARLAAVTLTLVSLAIPAAATRRSPGAEASDRVVLRISAGDCAGAAARLNEGLAHNHPEVNLLAGSMFENGVCLKADWARAVGFYSKAFEGGQKAAMYRLMSGFAAPEHGPDAAAALWWSHRPKGEFKIEGCTVSAGALGDPDRFVEELRTWTPIRLATCNYVVGVMATVSGEVRYPEKAQAHSVEGDIIMQFEPAIPRIGFNNVQTRDAPLQGLVNGNAQPDRGFRSVTGSFGEALGQMGARALKRYPQPASIPPGSIAAVAFHFVLEE